MSSTFRTHRHDAWVLSLALFDAVFVAVLFAGGVAANIVIPSSFAQGVAYNSSCESFTAPTSVKAGDPVVITAKFKNIGSATWVLADSRDQQNNIKLGSLDNWYPGRVARANTTPVTATVPSGGVVEFSFTARAPYVPGFYRGPSTPGTGQVFGWQLLGENSNPVGWFGATCGADINVLPSAEGLVNPIDITTGVVAGFAYDPQAIFKSIDVHFYIDRESVNSGGTFIGAIKANLSGTSPVAGNHRFTYSIPLAYRDNVQHTLYARAIDKEGGGSFPIGAPTTFTLSSGSANIPLPKPATLQYFGYYYNANTTDFRKESEDFTNISMVSDSAMLNANVAAGVKSVLHIASNICPPNSTHPSCAAFPTEALALAEFQRQFDIQWNEIKTYLDPNNDKNTSDSKIAALYFQDEPIWNSIANSQIAAASQYIKDKMAAEGLSPAIPIMLIESAPGLGFVTSARIKGAGESGPPEYCGQPTDAMRVELDPDGPQPPEKTRTRQKCTEPLKVPAAIDWIGYDAYGLVDPRKDTEWMAAYERLKSKRSNSNQKIVLVPDAWWHYCNHGVSSGARGVLDKSVHKEITKNYYELAKSDPDVLGMIGWLWHSYPDNCSELFPFHKQPSPHSIGMRDMPRAVLDENIRIGQEITGKTGSVIDSFVVTNLAGDDRPGSLRDAVSKGFRNITFNLLPGNDGIIRLTNEIDISGPHITIDASAVPAPGITLDGAGIKIRGDRGDKSAHNITIKNIRIRNAIEDGIQVAGGAHNILLDHISIRDSKDRNLDITQAGTRDVTVQNSIIVSPIPDTDEDDRGDQKNMLLGNSATGIRLYNNIIGFSNQRNPEISFDNTQDAPKGDTLDTDTGTTVDMRNNIIWKWLDTDTTVSNGEVGTRVERGAHVNVINNLFGGSPGEAESALAVCDNTTGNDCDIILNPAAAFVSGNRFLGTTVDLNQRGNVDVEFAVPAPVFVAQTPCVGAGTTVVNAGTLPRDAADDIIISAIGVGCSPFNELFITSAKWWQYTPNNDLTFQAKIYNHSNMPIQGGTAHLKITGASAPVLLNQPIALPIILPGAAKKVELPKGHKITSPGSYTVSFCIMDVDTGGVVDPDDSKNCIKGKLNVGGAVSGTDIVADKFIISSSLANGSAKIKTQIRAKNQGVLDAASVSFKYKIDTNEVFPAPFPAPIGAGKKRNVRATWRDDGVDAGKHNYSLCVDSPSTIVESDEANNCGNGFIMLVETAQDPQSVVTQFTQTLSKGARSVAVSNVQSFLSEELHFDETPTGYFGPLTETSVRGFQEENDLPATGVWDSTTRALANEIEGFSDPAVVPVVPPPPAKVIVPPPPSVVNPPPPVVPPPAAALPPPAVIVVPPPAPIVVPPPVPNPTASQVTCPKVPITLDIRRGSYTFNDKNSGGQISSLQEFLWQYRDAYMWNLKAIEKQRTFVTGIYGAQTENTIEFFQQQFGIAKKGDDEYGKVYQKTRDEILRQCGALAVLPNTSVPDANTPRAWGLADIWASLAGLFY